MKYYTMNELLLKEVRCGLLHTSLKDIGYLDSESFERKVKSLFYINNMSVNEIIQHFLR